MERERHLRPVSSVKSEEAAPHIKEEGRELGSDHGKEGSREGSMYMEGVYGNDDGSKGDPCQRRSTAR